MVKSTGRSNRSRTKISVQIQGIPIAEHAKTKPLFKESSKTDHKKSDIVFILPLILETVHFKT